MTKNLTIADVQFMLDNILAGDTPLPGADPFAPVGIRTIDGSNNNISGIHAVDQYGNFVDTSTFGVTGQGFFGSSALSSTLSYAPGIPFVMDSSPRVISNLIADATAANPSALASPSLTEGDPAVDRLPENSLFTFFGQFFDHGLDFIAKSNSEVIMIDILPGDPLYDPTPGAFNMMPVGRATLGPDGNPINTTAPFIEQSQTYGSTAATSFYLKRYDINGNATGDLVHAADGGLGTWADIKANANVWARAQAGANPNTVMLTDAHIFDIPNPDAWDPAANGGLGAFVGTVGTPVSTGQTFLADIAHNAVPNGTPDADSVINPHGFGAPPPAAGTYDNELLDAHFISGDPRANENTALTAIHNAFHSEHTRILGLIEDLILQQDQIQPGYAAQWTGEMKFQAAKIANEMQYQHLVFEEFGRRMSPNIDAFASYQVDINPNITAEFSQAVYRLGHSQLTDNVKALNATGTEIDTSLIEAFLNPVKYQELGSGDILKGGQFEQGARIDEFVVDGLRNFLVGLSLDLAAINIARGRDVNLPSLNQLRADLFAQTGDSNLEAYNSWDDFGVNLLNPSSLVNFIAAYSNDAAVVAARAIGDNSGARAAAQAAMSNAAFMGVGGDQGFQNIDLWIGGLAEKKVPLGLLGSTFDFVFAHQMLALQNGDRFYYLARLQGNLIDQIEGQTLADMMSRSGDGTHLHGDVFGTPDVLIEMGQLGVQNYLKSPAQLVEYLHEIIAGTHSDNIIEAGGGNDAVYGEGGNDTIYSGENNDHVYGGAGDDTIFGGLGFDLIRGDDGNDEIHGGGDDDAIFGNRGNDILYGDLGFDNLVGGEGNDIAYGGLQDDAFLGGEGNDTLYGGSGSDKMLGEAGDDVIFGGADDDILVGDIGDDMLYGGSGADAFDGGLGGYDVVNYDDYLTSQAPGSVPGLTINMINPLVSSSWARGDTFLDIEAVIGTIHDDVIVGDSLVGRVYDGSLGNDLITGGALGDVLIGGGGNDHLVGGAGIDTALFQGLSTDFTLAVTLGGFNVTRIATGEVDFVSNDIEWISYDNGLRNLQTGQWAPLIDLTNTTERVQNGTTLIGELQSNVSIMDGALLSGNGMFIGNIQILDPDGANGGPRTIAIDPLSPDAASFTIRNIGGVNQLWLTGGGPLSRVNYEAKQVYNVSLTATDTIGTSAINLTMKVTDVNDNAPVVTSVARVNVDAGTDASKIIYYAEATDLDTTPQTITYTLGGADAAMFNMVNGELRFINPAMAGGIYNVTVSANDGVQSSLVARKLAVHVGGTAAVNTITGTNLGETLPGTPGVDEIFGLGGNDTLTGGLGNDTLFGGNGADRLFGDDGADVMDGGQHADIYFADSLDKGADTGTIGVDVVLLQSTHGENFNLAGWSGIEHFRGNAGNNIINGTTQSQTIIVKGFDGNDNIIGGSGDDRLFGDNDNDILTGNGGADRLFGGAGIDTMFGGAGDDIIWVTEAGDVAHGGTEIDIAFVLVAGAVSTAAWTGVEKIVGANGAVDLIDAAGMANGATFLGRGGDDIITGSSFDDLINGGNGVDTLNGGAGTGNDILTGAAGGDVFIFNAAVWGQDTISDFVEGLDTINFVGSGVANALGLTISGINAGADTLLTETGTTNTITLLGVNFATIDGTEFVYV